MSIATQRKTENGAGVFVMGAFPILWGTDGLDRADEIARAFDTQIDNIPDGAISVKRVFARKSEARCIVETERFITEYLLEMKDGRQHIDTTIILSMREK